LFKTDISSVPGPHDQAAYKYIIYETRKFFKPWLTVLKGIGFSAHFWFFWYNIYTEWEIKNHNRSLWFRIYPPVKSYFWTSRSYFWTSGANMAQYNTVQVFRKSDIQIKCPGYTHFVSSLKANSYVFLYIEMCQFENDVDKCLLIKFQFASRTTIIYSYSYCPKV
jgi:hypothetical protein